MKKDEWFTKKLAEQKKKPDYIIEDILFDINERICEVLDQKGMSKKELAQKLGKSRPYITKILKGNQNMTVKTLVSLTAALGLKPVISIEEIESKISFSQKSGNRNFEDCCRPGITDLKGDKVNESIAVNAA